jgi:hypothetical protein
LAKQAPSAGAATSRRAEANFFFSCSPTKPMRFTQQPKKQRWQWEVQITGSFFNDIPASSKKSLRAVATLARLFLFGDSA